MKRFQGVIALLMLTILLQSCSSIPFSTMLKMSSFDEQDFVQLDPQAIRAKIRKDFVGSFDEEQTQLRVVFSAPTGSIDRTLKLVPIAETVEQKTHWFSQDTLEQTTIFKLSEESVHYFKELQHHPVVTNRGNGEFNITIRWGFNEDMPEKYQLSVDLLLDPKDGYFTLIDNYNFELSPEQAQN